MPIRDEAKLLYFKNNIYNNEVKFIVTSQVLFSTQMNVRIWRTPLIHKMSALDKQTLSLLT